MFFISDTEPPRTTNPLFRRKYQPPQSRKPIIITTTSPKSAQTITTIEDTLTTTPNPLGTDDQEAGQSIVSDKKYANHRYNQIGENIPFDDEIAEALQAISKAPLPYSPIFSTTAKYSSNTPFAAIFSTTAKYATQTPASAREDIVEIRRPPSTRRMLDLTTSPKSNFMKRKIK